VGVGVGVGVGVHNLVRDREGACTQVQPCAW
jgi:hypothetical protein